MERYGTVELWKANANAAQQIIQDQLESTENALVISIDTPFIGLLPILAREDNITHLHVPMSTSVLHAPGDNVRKRYELECIATASPNTFVAAICNYMKDHLCREYDVRPEKIIGMTNGSLPEDYQPYPEDELMALRKEWSINTRKKSIVAYGRAVPYKGFESLIEAVGMLPETEYQLLLNATTVDYEPTYIDALKQRAKECGIDMILHTEFDETFPIKVRQLDTTLAVVVPSLHEPFGLIPGEVMIDPNSKAIVIASDVEGLKEQIIPGVTGYNFKAGNARMLADAIQQASILSAEQREQYIRNARRYADDHYDARKNMLATLAAIHAKALPSYAQEI
jgi:glycosyltransferase involved in cell wall biosynthesis